MIENVVHAFTEKPIRLSLAPGQTVTWAMSTESCPRRTDIVDPRPGGNHVRRNSTTVLLAAWVALVLFSAAPRAGEVLSEPPANPDPRGKYLFYLHGIKVEEEGPNACSKREKACYDYHGIVAALAARGFTVISEIRPSGTHIGRYARQEIIPQIRSLVTRGVPRANITVIGHSKGGMIALVVSTLLRAPRINYVVMASCGIKGTEFRIVYQRLLDRGATLHGRVLSLYDEADGWAGTCEEAFASATALATQESAFRTGRGHCLFCVPDRTWIDPVAEWARL